MKQPCPLKLFLFIRTLYELRTGMTIVRPPLKLSVTIYIYILTGWHERNNLDIYVIWYKSSCRILLHNLIKSYITINLKTSLTFTIVNSELSKLRSREPEKYENRYSTRIYSFLPLDAIRTPYAPSEGKPQAHVSYYMFER